MTHLVVLLATFNGAAYIEQQLDSILGQTLLPSHIVVSDDGSTDATQEILSSYSAKHPDLFTLLEGPCEGSAANFMYLLTQIPKEATHAAFSDQDDTWFPHKLARAVETLNEAGSTPALYGARTLVTDAQGDNRQLSRETTIRPNLRHALVQNFAGGNTMVMNHAAIQIAERCTLLAQQIPAHDWWLYQVITAHAGQIFYDPEPVLLYRQHAGNLIGNNRGKRAAMRRLLWLLKGRYRMWNTQNLDALTATKQTIDASALSVIEGFAHARNQPLVKRVRAIRKLKLQRQGWDGSLGMWIGVLFNKI